MEANCHKLRLNAGKSTHQSEEVLKAEPFVFVVEWKNVATAASIGAMVRRIRRRVEEFKHRWEVDGEVIPLIVVPFMGDIGRERSAESAVSWLDLSGNARITAPGLRIRIEGNPNRYKRLGRPSTAFAPRSSRIARWLLMHPNEPHTQRQLARATGMDEGYTSRVVGKLVKEGLVVRNDAGAIRPADPSLLLDAWQEVYDFKKHRVLRGHVAARSGDALLKHLVAGLNQASVPYAATGLAASWCLGRYAGFRTASVYLVEEPSPDLIAALSFREVARGSNTWLVTPNDEGVLHGAKISRDGIVCVDPVQTYLDLHAHPERARDAARELRSEHLKWRLDD